MSDRSNDAGSVGRWAALTRVLANRSLRRVLTAYFLFNVAEWADWIALLVWAYAQHGVVGASALALVQLVPASLLAPVVARLSARTAPAKAVCLGYCAQSVGYASTGVALVLDAPFVVVAALAVFSATAITQTRPVHNTVLPCLAETTPELTAANTASGSVEAVATFLGPLVSAVLIVTWEAGGVLLAAAAGTAVGAAMTARLPLRGGEAFTRRSDVGSEVGSVRAVLANPTARTLTGIAAAEYVLVGMMDILLVVLALDVLATEESGPGLLNSAVGLGGLVGAAATVVLVGRQRLAPALVVGALAAGVPIALCGAAAGPLVAAALLGVAGAGKAFVDVGSRTLVQRALPDRMLVAVFGVQEATMMAGLAAGSLAAPLFVEALGTRWSFVAAGAFLPVVTVVSWRGLRRADARATVPQDVYVLLRRVPFLQVLAPRVVERLAIEAGGRSAVKGAVVVRQGDAGDDFFVLRSGTVDVDIDGRVVRRLGPGGWFGELALLHDAPRTATVTAADDAELLVIGRDRFLTAVTGVPASVEAADRHATGYEASGR